MREEISSIIHLITIPFSQIIMGKEFVLRKLYHLGNINKFHENIIFDILVFTNFTFVAKINNKPFACITWTITLIVFWTYNLFLLEKQMNLRGLVYRNNKKK